MAITFEQFVSEKKKQQPVQNGGKITFEQYIQQPDAQRTGLRSTYDSQQGTPEETDPLMKLAMESVGGDNHDRYHTAKKYGISTFRPGFGYGNIDLTDRPMYKNPDGSISTVDSFSTNIDGREVLLPQIGRDAQGNTVRWTEDQAIDNYLKTGENLGTFRTVDDANAYAEWLHNQQAGDLEKRRNDLITQIKVTDKKIEAAKRDANTRTTMKERANLSGLANTAAREEAQAYMDDRYAKVKELQEQRASLMDQLHAAGGKYGVGDFVGDALDALQAGLQTPLTTLEKADYWLSEKLGLVDRNDENEYARALALENDIAQQAEAAMAGRNDLGRTAIGAFQSAGNVLGSTAFAYATGIPQGAQQLLGPVAANLSATEAGLGANAGQRAIAGASRFAGNLLGDVVANPTNAVISAQSGIGAYDRAKTAGASDSTAFAAGIANAATEYLSNKMFSGTPLLDSPEEKGYVVELIEAAAEKAGKSGTVSKLFSNGLVNFVFDKSGEGLEEVITGVLDPLIEKLTYNPDADLATASDLFDEYIGGVAMSLLLGAAEPITNFQGRKAEARAADAARAAANAGMGGMTLENAARELQRSGNNVSVEDLRLSYDRGVETLNRAAKTFGVETEGKSGPQIRADVDAAIDSEIEKAKSRPMTQQQALDMVLDENANMGETGKKYARELFRLTQGEDGNALDFYRGFDAIYQAARRGETAADVMSQYGDALTPQAAQAAFNAGVEDMAAAMPQTAPQQAGERFTYTVEQNDGGRYAVTVRDAQNGSEYSGGVYDTQAEADQVVNDFKKQMEGVTVNVESGTENADGGARVPGREGRGGVRGRAEAAAEWRAARQRAAEDIRNSVYAAEDGEEVSNKEAGISGGTDEKSMRLVRKYENDEMRGIKAEAAKKGVNVVFFLGEIRAMKGGKKIAARGEYSADGKTFYIALDDPDFTARQIFDHEDFHERSHSDAELQQIAENIINSHSAAELQEMVAAYVNAYGWTDMSNEEIIQEILADAYAGIDIFMGRDVFEGATRFTEDVRGAVKAREGEQQQERGPPAEAKLSEKLTHESEGRELTPETVDETTLPPDEEVLFSQKFDAEYMRNAEDFNKKSRIVPESVLRNARKAREIAKQKLDAIKDLLPPDIEGNTWYDDSSYGGTQENTTICPRSLALEELMDAVAEELGRPLTVEDTVFIAQEAMAYTDKPECLYCYVAMDRKAYRDALGKYIDQRDAFLKDVADGMEIGLAAPTAKNAGSRKVPKDSAYGRFLNGRANTENMYNRAQLWLNTNKAITKQDVASAARMNAALNDPALREQILDVMDYAQKATRAKKKVGYTAYDNGILKWSDERVRDLNRMYGMRMYSFSDFSPAFILENMQMITDASVRGLKALGYTKELDFVKIFAPSGININVSVFGYNDWKTGEIAMDAMQGADWNEAKALRAQYPNVGCTFVATNDAQVEWALAQDWIDVVIPYHIVRTGANVAKMFGWENYQRMQEDKKNPDWTAGDSTHIYPYQHQNNKATYLRLCKQNHLTPRFSKWVDNPNYMKLVNETRQSDKQTKPVKPIFNTEFIDASIDEMVKRGGYVQHIGGTVENMQDIASETAEKIRSGKSAIRTEAKLSQKITPQQDADYAAAVERGDTETAQKMVDEAAKAAGYDTPKLYHGTRSFGFTEFDPAKSDDRISLFATDNKRTAETYSGETHRTRISDRNRIDVDSLSGEQLLKEAKKHLNRYQDYRLMSEKDRDDIRKDARHDILMAKKDAQGFIDEHDGAFDSTKYAIVSRATNALTRLASAGNEDAVQKAWDDWQEAVWDFKDSDDSLCVEFLEAIGSKQLYFAKNHLEDVMYSGDMYMTGDDYSYSYIYDNQLALELDASLHKGIYALYGKPGKQLVINADGSNWNQIKAPEELNLYGPQRTRDIAAAARALGYDSILFKNLRDNGGETAYNGTSNVYIFFDANRMKSADPVTYDDDGNVIPLSERFNPENEDIRYSQKLTAEDELRRQNETLQKRVEYWKGQTKRTTVPTARAEDAVKAARQIVKDYDSTADAKEIGAALKDLTDYIMRGENITYAEVKDRAVTIARDLVENAKTLQEGDGETFREVRAALQKPLIISAQDAHDVTPDGWGKYRDSIRGKVNVSINGKGTPIDTAYQELSERFPSLFPEEITHPADQLQHMVDVIDELTPVYENPFSYNMAEAIEYAANDIINRVFGDDIRMNPPTFADKAAAKLAAEKARGAERVAEVREQKNAQIVDIKARNAWATAQRIAEVKKQRDAQIAALKEHYAEAKKTASERKADSAARTRLLKIAKRLQNKKLPAVSRALLEQYIGNLDTVSKSITGRSVENLVALREWYDDQKANNPDFIADAATEAKIARLSKTQISDMTPTQVAELTEVLLNFENEINTQRRMIDSEDKRDTRQMVLESLYNVEETKGSKKTAADWLVTNTLSPERLIKRLTGYAETDPLLMRTQDLSEGQRRMFDYQRRAEARFSRWANDKKLMDRLRSKERVKITGFSHGRPVEVEITPDMRMALYLHSLNDENMKHIANGGVTIPDIDIYLNGDIGEAYSRGKTIKLSPSNIRSIVAGMSAEERAYAKAAHDYFNGMSKDEINATSEKLVGYSIAGVDDYFPIETDKNFTKSDIAELKRDGTIEGMGFLKERQHASNAIYLVPLTDVLNKSIQNHAKYVGMAIPVRNFSKIWGMNAHNDAAGEDNGLRQAIGQKWGERGIKAVERIISDVQNPSRSEDGKLLAKIRSNYAAAVLTLNASVALKQAASYPTAAAVLGWEPLIKAMGNVGKVNLDLINKYTPLQWYRSKGYSTQELGDIRSKGGVMDKVLSASIKTKDGREIPLLNWIQGIDLATTRKLWKASEYYVQQHNADLQRGSDAYYKAVADIYNRVIEETQPNYTTMQRPQILRSSNQLLQSLVMFKTQPFQNFNILYDAIGELRAAERASKNGDSSRLTQAKKNAVNAVSSNLVSAVVFAAMTMAWAYARRKKDKYEDKDGNFNPWAQLGKDVLSSEFGMIPFGSDAYNLFASWVFGEKYYGMSNITADSISGALDATKKAVDTLSKTVNALLDDNETTTADPETVAKELFDCAKDLSKIAGVPLENTVNLVTAVYTNVASAVNGEYITGYEILRNTKNMESSYNKSAAYDMLYKAMKQDMAQYNELRRMMIEDGFKEKNIDAAMKKRAENK